VTGKILKDLVIAKGKTLKFRALIKESGKKTRSREVP
jgi:hypothetical protein